MNNRVSILGSTGSIGRQSIDVIKKLGLSVCALTAGSNIRLLEEQARELRPEAVAVFEESAARELKVSLGDTDIRVLSGICGLTEAAAMDGADTVITAVMGTVGLKPTMAAIKQKKRIALANKETLVCAGEIVMEAAKEYGAEIIPVDSEHSAIFQCLEGGNPGELKKIILTASGGPFRTWERERLEGVTKEQALAHPNWSMGPKITVDSATMMNKGLEFIEAMHLFGVSPEKIEVVIHPQSVIHSMVEFTDNAVIAQLGLPDMRLPIQYALTYPERVPSPSGELDFSKVGALTFEKPDLEKFRCLALAMDIAREPGASCAVMNGANEEAVSLFLKDKIKFTRIYELVSETVEVIKNKNASTIDEILAADNESRNYVRGKA